MMTAAAARLQNKQTVERLVSEDYDVAVKMIDGLITSAISKKVICTRIEIDMLSKEAKMICGSVISMLKTKYTDLGYKFSYSSIREANQNSKLIVSWEE